MAGAIMKRKNFGQKPRKRIVTIDEMRAYIVQIERHTQRLRGFVEEVQSLESDQLAIEGPELIVRGIREFGRYLVNVESALRRQQFGL